MGISRKARREIVWILLLVACLSFTYFLVFGQGGYLRLRDYRSELRELQLENLRLRESQKELRERIHRLRTDPYEIERLARERYDLARPGDIIVTIPKPDRK
jgi:cell division protein FtsB